MPPCAEEKSDDDVVFKGAKLSIAYAVCSNGEKPAKTFLEGLELGDRAKMRNLFEWLANEGRIVHREKFKKEDGEIWGFKSFQVRMGCFRNGMTWYLTHGFIKKSNDWKQEEIDRAHRIRIEHLKRPSIHKRGRVSR